METTPTRAVEDCLIELFQALGIAQAHIAAGQLVSSDWLGLAAGYLERVASLILVSPRPRSELNGLKSRLLVVAGDKGMSAQGPAKLLADLPSVAAHILRDYGVPGLLSLRRNLPQFQLFKWPLSVLILDFVWSCYGITIKEKSIILSRRFKTMKRRSANPLFGILHTSHLCI
jgi:hypothetical protein